MSIASVKIDQGTEPFPSKDSSFGGNMTQTFPNETLGNQYSRNNFKQGHATSSNPPIALYQTVKDNSNHENDTLRQLANDFGSLLDRTDISDCFLCVQGTYMAVHRCVLAARSKTFSDVISAFIQQSNSSSDSSKAKEKMIITIDKTHPDVMKELIVFLYSGRCNVNQHNAYDLFQAAGRYDIKSLKIYVTEFLINHIDQNNILILLAAAYKYDNILLKKHCISYFLHYSKEIIDVHQLWNDFAKENPSIVSELLYWVVHPNKFSMESRTNQYSEW